MTKGKLNNLLAYLHQLADPSLTDQPTDGELLKRFTGQGDEAAFQTLLRRHGPMVLATCQRILRDIHEAEDCFQATFLVLARKARSIVKHGSLGTWLYRVAYHVAINARARALKQRAREREAANMSRDEPQADGHGPELTRLLDEELRRLPEKYRAPLVLCYLEGKTHEEAARELRWPTGSMSRRLARGQQLFHQRLVRRGLALSLAALGSALASQANAATVPLALLDATTRAAVLLTGVKGATAGIASVKIAILTEDALRAMAIARFKTAALVLVSVALLSVGAATAFWHPVEPSAPTLAARSESRPVTIKAAPNEDRAEWGEPVHGIRLRCSCDRGAYRMDKDIIRVTFALQNVSTKPQSVQLMRDGQEFTDVRLIGPDGKEHFVPGMEIPLPSRASRGGNLRPNGVDRVSMIFDPARIDGGLQPGLYRLRGLFRRQPTADLPLTVAELRLDSNETAFRILPANAKIDNSWSGGEAAGGCSLTLFRLEDRPVWKTGSDPLSFAVVLNRLNDDLRTLRFLQANRLGLYYRLEITGPSGKSSIGVQPAESAGVDPVVDRWAYTRLLFLQLDRIPVGKSLGERLAWDPSGTAEHRGYCLEPVTCCSPQWGPGRYTIRAIYQLRERDQKQFGSRPEAIRLVSNPVELQIGE